VDTKHPDELNNHWQQQVDAWKNSGLSQVAFCKQQKLVYHRFIYWKLKFAGSSQANQQSHLSSFVKVKATVKRSATEANLSLTLPNGMVFSGLSESNLSLIHQFIEQMS